MRASWKFNQTALALAGLLAAMSALAEDGGMTASEIEDVKVLVSDSLDELASQTEPHSEERDFLLRTMASVDIAPNEFRALLKLSEKISNMIGRKGEKDAQGT